MISNLGSIEGELRKILAHIDDCNVGFAREKLISLIGSLAETPLSLIRIDTQAVRALEQVTEKRIEDEREKIALDYQQRFEERLKANNLS